MPTLVVHHAHDACWACPPADAKRLADALRNAPIKKIMLLDGGAGASGDPCEPLHHHGYVGMQQEVVDVIAAWIIKPVPSGMGFVVDWLDCYELYSIITMFHEG